MVIVRRAVLSVYGDIDFVRAGDEVEAIDGEDDFAVAGQFLW